MSCWPFLAVLCFCGLKRTKPSGADSICPRAKATDPLAIAPPGGCLSPPGESKLRQSPLTSLCPHGTWLHVFTFSECFIQVSKGFLGLPWAWPSAPLWGPETRRLTHHFQRASVAEQEPQAGSHSALEFHPPWTLPHLLTLPPARTRVYLPGASHPPPPCSRPLPCFPPAHSLWMDDT